MLSWWLLGFADNIVALTSRKPRNLSVELLGGAGSFAEPIAIVVGEVSPEFAPESAVAFLRILRAASELAAVASGRISVRTFLAFRLTFDAIEVHVDAALRFVCLGKCSLAAPMEAPEMVAGKDFAVVGNCFVEH